MGARVCASALVTSLCHLLPQSGPCRLPSLVMSGAALPLRWPPGIALRAVEGPFDSCCPASPAIGCLPVPSFFLVLFGKVSALRTVSAGGLNPGAAHRAPLTLSTVSSCPGHFLLPSQHLMHGLNRNHTRPLFWTKLLPCTPQARLKIQMESFTLKFHVTSHSELSCPWLS